MEITKELIKDLDERFVPCGDAGDVVEYLETLIDTKSKETLTNISMNGKVVKFENIKNIISMRGEKSFVINFDDDSYEIFEKKKFTEFIK